MIVRPGNFARILPQIGTNVGAMRRFSGESRLNPMDISQRFNSKVAQVRQLPNEFEGAGFSPPPLGSGFLKASRIDEFFPAIKDARQEVSKLMTDDLDLKLDTKYGQTHIFDEGPDANGRTKFGICSIVLKLNDVVQDPNTELFLRVMPRTADLAFEAAARVDAFEPDKSPVQSIIVRLVVYRLGWDTYCNDSHRDYGYDIHVPIWSKNAYGTTTYTHRDGRKISASDVPSLTDNKGCSHEVLVEKLQKGPGMAYRIMMNVGLIRK